MTNVNIPIPIKQVLRGRHALQHDTRKWRFGTEPGRQ